MKKILIMLMLISPFSFADWWDVYYCQETTHSKTTREGNRTDYKLEKFQFKLDKTKNAMVFVKSAHFNEKVFNLEAEWREPEREFWWFSDIVSKGLFYQGRFVYSSVTFVGITSITAKCDKL